MLGIPEREWSDVAMAANNLALGIRGANALRLVTIWFGWNQRYPWACVDDAEIRDYLVSSAADLGDLLERLMSGSCPAQYAYPRSFPWDKVG